jgi:hypothetical protein
VEAAQKVKLLSDWKEILKKAWSIRLILVAGVLTGIEALLPLVAQKVPHLPAITFIVIAAAFISRLLAQQDSKGE